MNDLIRDKLKKFFNSQDIIKTDKYVINQRVKKFITLVNILCLLFFKRYK